MRRQQLLGRTELWTLLIILLMPRQGQHIPGEHKKHINGKVSVVEQADGRRMSNLKRERVSARTARVGEHLGEIAAQHVGHEDEEEMTKHDVDSCDPAQSLCNIMSPRCWFCALMRWLMYMLLLLFLLPLLLLLLLFHFGVNI